MLLLFIASGTLAGELDPQSARMVDGALQQLENLRRQAPTLQYDATAHVTEWDGKGRVRGTATAQMTVRPGERQPITYVSREVHGKVKLPDDSSTANDPKDKEEETNLQQFARDHRINERFDFHVPAEPEQTTVGAARRIDFTPKPNQPEKNRADRFLDAIHGTAWIAETQNRFAKFQMQLVRPYQLFWIIAVLKEFSLEYELLEPDEYLGHARLKIAFWLSTPVYSLHQQHDIELRNFRKRDTTVALR